MSFFTYTKPMTIAKEKFECAVCGKITTGRLPRNGDGTFWYPRRHNVSGIPCEGNIQEADPLVQPIPFLQRIDTHEY